MKRARTAAGWVKGTGRGLRTVARVLLLLSGLAALPARAAAEVAPDSPQAAYRRFLELTGEGRDAEAARWLEVPGGASNGARLARRVRDVLEQSIWIDPQEVSPLSGGRVDDGLPPDVDELGMLPGKQGRAAEPIRMIRKASEGRWVFSRRTVQNMDTWLDGRDRGWLAKKMPEPLLKRGPGGLMWWQWLALPVLILLAAAAGALLSRVLRSLFRRIARRTSAIWDDGLIDRFRGPLALASALLVARLLIPLLSLPARPYEVTERWLSAGFLVAFFWALGRSVGLGASVAMRSPWAKHHAASRSLVPLAARVGKVAVLAVAVVAMLSELGYPVASLIAGLGIGGLAFALAAQKTVENLFGAFSIGADQPFREGDFVKVESFMGTVETIGLRSTRIRTLERTLVTIPNGKLAEMMVESFSAKDRSRFTCELGLVYGTTAAQVRDIVAGVEAVLRGHPKLWSEAMVVSVKGLGPSSIDIEVMAWFQTVDGHEFQTLRQEMLLAFMEVVERAGTSLAFPTRTLHLVGDRDGNAVSGLGGKTANAGSSRPLPG